MRIALVQMNSRDDRDANVREASRLLEEAAAEGADLAALPELFTYLGPGAEHPRVAEPIPGPTTERLSALAARHRMFIQGGSILERVPGVSRFSNTSTLFVPAAFTLHTGKDHWEVLLRARAIETYLKEVRLELPALAHRRRELLG